MVLAPVAVDGPEDCAGAPEPATAAAPTPLTSDAPVVARSPFGPVLALRGAGLGALGPDMLCFVHSPCTTVVNFLEAMSIRRVGLKISPSLILANNQVIRRYWSCA